MHGEDAYLFRHAIMRDAAYQLQLPGERARLHALAFGILEDLARREGEAALDRWAEEMAEHAGHAAEHGGDNAAALRAAEADYLFRAADFLRRTFEHAKSIELMNRLLRHGSIAPVRRVKVQIQLGSAHRTLGHLEDAELWSKKGLQAALELGMSSDELAARVNLANLSSDKGNYAEAITQCRDALSRADVLGDMGGKARALVNLAANLGLIDAIEEPIALARQGLDLARANANRHAEGYALKTLGDAYDKAGRSEEAEAAYVEARELLAQCGAKLNLASCWNNLGVLYWNSNRGAMAKEAYAHALRLYAEAGAKRQMGYTLVNYALFFLGSGEAEQAQSYAVSALNTFREVGALKEANRWLAEWTRRTSNDARYAPLP